MNYHIIKKDDMLNGSGIRVVLFLSGCSHSCVGCHNPQTHNPYSGIEFDVSAEKEIFEELKKDYISGITLTGGDPLHENNLKSVLKLVNKIRLSFGENKSIWLYTGYTYEEIQERIKGIGEKPIKINEKNNLRCEIVSKCDVLVDGRFVQALGDINYPYAGSTNQRVIDVKETLNQNKVTLLKN